MSALRSSIEYFRNRDKYTFIEGHSISSIGPVGSIILFSSKTIEALDGHTILTSSQSATSVALLEIILAKSFKVKCNLKPAKLTQGSMPSDIEAYLLIGDDALKAVKYYRTRAIKKTFYL